jgi:hypothetical protein
MTYKTEIPSKVTERWKQLNPSYTIDFSLDHDCIHFLREHFNDYIANLFITIPVGMYKADLWRLCKLYVYGGIYADVDLVPYIHIDNFGQDVAFYSCLSKDPGSIFQAFIINWKPNSPLILHFIISFLMNQPIHSTNGPTYDMYNCVKYNLNGNDIRSMDKYFLKEIKIPINIGSSDSRQKVIDLIWFPYEVQYSIRLHPSEFNDQFDFKIENNQLIVSRIDEIHENGWGHNHKVDIVIPFNETIYFFQEHMHGGMDSAYVEFHNTKLFDCRDPYYFAHNGWN